MLVTALVVVSLVAVSGCASSATGAAAATVAPAASVAPAAAAAPATPAPAPVTAAAFDFESGVSGSAPAEEGKLLPVVIEAVVSTDKAKTGKQSVKISDTSSTTTGYLRATVSSLASGSLKASVYVPSGIDGTAYVTLWSGGNTQASNMCFDVVFSIDGTLKYRQQNESKTQIVLMKADGTSNLMWNADAWNDVVISWSNIAQSNVVTLTLNGEVAKTGPSDKVAGATPVEKIPVTVTALVPDRLEVKYGNNGSNYTKSIYVDGVMFK